jgi:hypothetical protein
VRAEVADVYRVAVHCGAEAAERAGKGDLPVEGAALRVYEGEVAVHLPVRVADERARVGGGELVALPLVEDDRLLAERGGGGCARAQGISIMHCVGIWGERRVSGVGVP